MYYLDWKFTRRQHLHLYAGNHVQIGLFRGRCTSHFCVTVYQVIIFIHFSDVIRLNNSGIMWTLVGGTGIGGGIINYGIKDRTWKKNSQRLGWNSDRPEKQRRRRQDRKDLGLTLILRNRMRWRRFIKMQISRGLRKKTVIPLPSSFCHLILLIWRTIECLFLSSLFTCISMHKMVVECLFTRIKCWRERHYALLHPRSLEIGHFSDLFYYLSKLHLLLRNPVALDITISFMEVNAL